MKQCVVNVSVGKWYPRGQERMRQSLRQHGFDGDMLFWTDDLPPGCPTHAESPYMFKIAALEMAMLKRYDLALWCDSSVWFIRDPQPIFDAALKRGCWIMTQGFYVGQWCSDEVLPKLDLDRESAMSMVMVSAAVFALDLRSEAARQILGWMRAKSREGAFCGPWGNDDGEASSDPRVFGHRHDQTALSVVVHRLGIPVDMPPGFVQYRYDGQPVCPETIALAEGM